MDRKIKLEAMLLHLLHSKHDGKVWIAITVPGVARFTREDVAAELQRARRSWWQTLLEYIIN